MYKESPFYTVFDTIALDASVFPTAQERGFWERVPAEVRNTLTAGAEELRGTPWPQVLCSQTLAFERTGDRSAMEEPHFEKRKRLAKLVAAECFEHEGRYLDDIMDGLALIAGEPFWGVSAHYPVGQATDLPDGERQNYIDLFAAETAALIARTVHLLRDELTSECSELLYYLDGESERRIRSVFLCHDEFWWMGNDRKKRGKLNNWSPWITSQLMTVFLLTEKDEGRKHAGIRRCMEIQDRYMNDVPFDGGIDEGPTYWGVAGGKMLESVNLLYAASRGKIDLTRDVQLGNITDFVRKAYVGGGFCVNFNDASPLAGADANMLYALAKTNGSEKLLAFSYEMAKLGCVCSGGRNLSIFFNGLKNASELLNGTPAGPWASLDSYLPGIQMVTAREKENGSGLFLAAKGNHNAESHNHNDVGTFVLFRDSVPFAVDLGQGTYTKQTFSEHRYEIANCRSDWHNLPIVNGAGQVCGGDRRAENFTYRAEETLVDIGMELQSAYGEASGAEKIDRRIRLERGEAPCLCVRDTFRFREDGNTVEETLILAGNVRCTDQGIIAEQDGVNVQIVPLGACVIGEPEEYTEDGHITGNWGRRIFRVKLTFTGDRELTAGYTVR